jgi:hypothetical protein
MSESETLDQWRKRELPTTRIPALTPVSNRARCAWQVAYPRAYPGGSPLHAYIGGLSSCRTTTGCFLKSCDRLDVSQCGANACNEGFYASREWLGDSMVSLRSWCLSPLTPIYVNALADIYTGRPFPRPFSPPIWA